LIARIFTGTFSSRSLTIFADGIFAEATGADQIDQTGWVSDGPSEAWR
jgi:hypothetical protein